MPEWVWVVLKLPGPRRSAVACSRLAKSKSRALEIGVSALGNVIGKHAPAARNKQRLLMYPNALSKLILITGIPQDGNRWPHSVSAGYSKQIATCQNKLIFIFQIVGDNAEVCGKSLPHDGKAEDDAGPPRQAMTWDAAEALRAIYTYLAL